VLSFVVIALLERFVFAPHLPEALRNSDVKAKAWTRFLVPFYGGIDEEILLRLFIVSGLAWILGRFWVNASGLPTNGAFWTAIILAAILFGLGHLPATKAIVPLTTMIVVRAVVLNGLARDSFRLALLEIWLRNSHGSSFQRRYPAAPDIPNVCQAHGKIDVRHKKDPFHRKI
jgi:membrane protease YdiL (CAAX protease family)